MSPEIYPLAAFILAVLIQFIRKFRLTAIIWDRCPEGWRWTIPVVSGAVAGFLAAYDSGTDWRGALLGAAYGAVGIGVGSMGLHALAKESPLPIDGGAGGHRRQAVILPPATHIHLRDPRDEE